MNGERTTRYRRLLEEERDRLRAEAEAITARGLTLGTKDSTGELSLYDNHPADGGDVTFERGKDVGLKSGLRIRLAAVEEALRRLDRGDYGYCEDCGRPIDEERLAAVPWTTLCYDCRRRSEEPIDPFRRPAEEDVMGPPFGRSFLDEAEPIMFDGEDAWQAVARYGTADSPQDAPPARDVEDAYVDPEERRGAVTGLEEVIDEEDDLLLMPGSEGRELEREVSPRLTPPFPPEDEGREGKRKGITKSRRQRRQRGRE